VTNRLEKGTFMNERVFKILGFLTSSGGARRRRRSFRTPIYRGTPMPPRTRALDVPRLVTLRSVDRITPFIRGVTKFWVQKGQQWPGSGRGLKIYVYPNESNVM